MADEPSVAAGPAAEAHPAADATSRSGGLFRALSAAGQRGGRIVAALWMATLVVGLLDVATIAARGGRWMHLPFSLGLLTVMGLGFGVAAWAAGEVLAGLAGVGGRVARRCPGRRAVVSVGVGVGLAWGLFPAHATFSKNVLGAYIATGWSVVPLILASRWYLQTLASAAAGRLTRGRWALAGAGSLVAVGLHLANALYFYGLYPGLHRTLSGLIVLVVAAVAALWLVTWRVRWWWGLAALPLLGLAVGDIARVRSPVFFFGTHLKDLHQIVDRLLDRDGDGISPWGGDCDEGDRQRHPLAAERPGNGLDDNCTGGDLIRAPRTAPVVQPEAPALAAWRAAHPRPNVVVFFVDTLRADHLGPDTPHLAALAARGVVFEQARTAVPRTPMALMSLLRGRFVSRVTDRSGIADPQGDTLVAHLQARGYQVGARLVGTDWADHHLSAGWQPFIAADSVGQQHGQQVTEDALRLLETTRAPFVLFLHYADPHAPYVTETTGSKQARYAAEVRFTDAQVGRVLDRIEASGRAKDTLVVLFSDHGEDLGDHGGLGGHHGVSVFEEVAHVPLIVAGPGIQPRRVVDPVSLVDLAPTLLALLGAAPLDDPDGCALPGLLMGEGSAPAFTITEFYDAHNALRALVAGHHKLVVNARTGVWQLYDLQADPQERSDIADAHPAVVAALWTELNRWVEERADGNGGPNRRCGPAVP